MKPRGEEVVQTGVRISADTMHKVRLRATIENRSIRSIMEEAIEEWVERHPVDTDALNKAVG